jgi:hypothetical protein
MRRVSIAAHAAGTSTASNSVKKRSERPGYAGGRVASVPTYAPSLSAAISRSQPASWFQLAMFWPTNSKSLILHG